MDLTTTVNLPGHVTIVVTQDKPEEPPPYDYFGDVLAPFLRPDVAPVRTKVARLDVVYREVTRPTGDPGGEVTHATYRQISAETDLHPTQGELLRQRQLLVDSRTRVKVTGSWREIWSTFFLAAGTDETDGTLTGLTFTDQKTGEARHYELIGETRSWQREVPVGDALSRLELERASPATPPSALADLDRAILDLRTRSYEAWELQIERRDGAGTVEGYMPPGRKQPAVTSYMHFVPFGPGPEFGYSDEPGWPAPLKDPIALELAEGRGARATVWVAPRTHEYFASWFAAYTFGSFLSSGLVFIATQRSWRDSLPWEPQPYRITSIGNLGANDDAMSRRISLSNHYAAMLVEDARRAVTSAYFSLTLEGRYNGKWRLWRLPVLAGTLCGIVRIETGRGPDDYIERYVTRLVDEPVTQQTLEDEGNLFTDLVFPDIGLFSPTNFEF